jgi:S1-C subfamily serine protease
MWLVYLEVGYRCGGSFGKLLLGLRVTVPNRRTYFFREIIGKAASVATFGVGFAIVLSKDGLAMHDYMAKTAVIEGRAPFRGSQAVAIALLACVGVFVSYRITVALHQEKPSLEVAENENFIERVTKQVAAVGTIYTYGKTGAAIAQGSAFVLNSAGLAATNVHVLEGAFRADCRLGDGRLFNVLAIQGFDASEDVALFQLGRTINGRVELPSSLTFVKIGSSAGVKVGDRVVTISSPKGLSNTISDGLVSSIREEEGRRFIQTTAPISSGSSGSPLFNTKGEVIGLTTMQVREGQNLNFAVPIEKVADLLQRREGLALPEFQTRIAPRAPTSPRLPIKSKSVFETANAAFRAGDYGGALRAYERAQELDTADAAAYYNAALCYRQLGDPPNAARMYYLYLLRSDDDDPDREKVLNWLTEMKFPIPQK